MLPEARTGSSADTGFALPMTSGAANKSGDEYGDATEDAGRHTKQDEDCRIHACGGSVVVNAEAYGTRVCHLAHRRDGCAREKTDEAILTRHER